MSKKKYIIEIRCNTKSRKNIRFISPKNSLGIVPQDQWHNRYWRLFYAVLSEKNEERKP